MCSPEPREEKADHLTRARPQGHRGCWGSRGEWCPQDACPAAPSAVPVWCVTGCLQLLKTPVGEPGPGLVLVGMQGTAVLCVQSCRSCEQCWQVCRQVTSRLWLQTCPELAISTTIYPSYYNVELLSLHFSANFTCSGNLLLYCSLQWSLEKQARLGSQRVSSHLKIAFLQYCYLPLALANRVPCPDRVQCAHDAG